MATRKIEIDEPTAVALEARAAEIGVSVSELIAQFVEGEPVSLPADQIAELDRRWAAVGSGDRAVPQEEVVGWLQTWGTPAFRPLRV
jgi:hypothetical protein